MSYICPMKRLLLLFSLTLTCHLQAHTFESGQWQGIIEYVNGEVPFSFTVENKSGKLVFTIKNGVERIQIDDATLDGDSIRIPLKPFDAWLKAKVERHTMVGFWRKGYRTKGIPFKAFYGAPRFESSPSGDVKKLLGNYQLEIKPPSGLPYSAIGIFNVTDSSVTGTFMTEVSDLRFFEGVLADDSIFMSSFDGAHAFLFNGRVDLETISGELVMDSEYSERVTGIQNPSASIPIPFKEVSAGHRPYYDILSAGDPNLTIDESDYFNKVLVLQLFGTWCPNSMDQTRFLREWYKKRPAGVELLAVSYEPNFSVAYGNERTTKYKFDMSLPYQVALGGKLSKGQAALSLPHLEKLNAFPTLILVDKQGFIRYEFSYFNGPATGIHHQAFQEKFEECISKLADE